MVEAPSESWPISETEPPTRSWSPRRACPIADGVRTAATTNAGSNSGWDEDNIRFHFVPIPDSQAPALNGFCTDPSAANTGGTIWRRMFGGSHPGGVNVLLGDGSVRFVKFTVDPSAFRRLAVIDDNEPMSADQY